MERLRIGVNNNLEDNSRHQTHWLHRKMAAHHADEILSLQLITAKLGGSIVSLEIEITRSMRHTESTTGVFHFPVWDLLLPRAGIDTR